MRKAAAQPHRPSWNFDQDIPVQIPADEVVLDGILHVPETATGVVIFAHGSGSSRNSPRNRYVAEVLHEHHLATLLLDLLTPDEETVDMRTRELRFDIKLLASRLDAAGEWASAQPVLKEFKIGYFGSSTGGAAALVAAAQHPKHIAAVVSRGGRPDLAGEDLYRVKSPVLLIVGEHDPQVLALNRQALEKLNTHSRLDVVPRATHLFEEPGTLEDAAHLAAEWFEKLK
jgi:dienelactone hydrolase